MPKTLHKGSLFLADYTEMVRKLCDADPNVAERFCDAIERALDLLSIYPELGVKAGFRHAPRVRKWVIKEFPNYIMFYENRPEGLLFIRLLHGVRDLPPLIPKG